MTIIRKHTDKADGWTLLVKVDNVKGSIEFTSSYEGGDTIGLKGSGLSAWGMVSIIECMCQMNSNRKQICETAYDAIKSAEVWGFDDKHFIAKIEHMKTAALHTF